MSDNVIAQEEPIPTQERTYKFEFRINDGTMLFEIKNKANVRASRKSMAEAVERIVLFAVHQGVPITEALFECVQQGYRGEEI